MKRAMLWALRLYPRAWRERYLDEFVAMLEQMEPGWWQVADVMKGGFAMRIREWQRAPTIALFAMMGGLLALAGSYAIPSKYASTGLVSMQHQEGVAASQAVNQLAQRSLSRASLTKVIDELGLYQELRLRLPMEDVIEQMRRAIRISSADPAAKSFHVSYVSSNQREADAVAQALMRLLVNASNAPDSQSRLVAVELRSDTMPIFPNRWTMATLGLLAGLSLGGVVGFIRSRRASRGAR